MHDIPACAQVLVRALQQYSPAVQVLPPQTTLPSRPASNVPFPQPVLVEKQPSFGQEHLATVWLLVGEQPHAPVRHESGKSLALPQQSPLLICPPVVVHRDAKSDASRLT